VSTTTATVITVTTVTTTVVTPKRPIQCYECSGPECGKEGSGTSNNCPSCMVYRNPTDQSKSFYSIILYLLFDTLISKN